MASYHGLNLNRRAPFPYNFIYITSYNTNLWPFSCKESFDNLYLGFTKRNVSIIFLNRFLKLNLGLFYMVY